MLTTPPGAASDILEILEPLWHLDELETCIHWPSGSLELQKPPEWWEPPGVAEVSRHLCDLEAWVHRELRRAWC